MSLRVLCLSPKGGSGKSTLARNISASAAVDGFKVTALDTDDQGTLSAWATARQQHEDVPAVDVRFSGIVDAPQAFDECALLPDVLIIDTPTALEAYPKQIRHLIDGSDIVLIPTQPTVDDVRSVQAVMVSIQELGKTAAFVINRVRPRVLESEAARRELGAVGPVIAAGIPDSVEIQRAMAAGLGVVETSGKGHEEMTSVWREIKRIIGLNGVRQQ